MALIKATFFFERGKYGWSENWYKTASSTSQPGLQTDIVNLWKARQYLSPKTVKMPYVRWSDETIRGDSLVYEPVLTDGVGKYPNFIDFGAEIDSALLVRIEGGSLHRRIFALRGIPESIVTSPDAYNESDAAFNDAWFLFSNALLGSNVGAFPQTLGPWQIRIQNPMALTAAISALIPDPSSSHRIIVTLAGPLLGASVGAAVRVTGVKSPSNCNGTWRISANPTSQLLTLGPRLRGVAADTYLGNGVIQLLSPVGTNITALIRQRLGDRDTGRPFDSPVGRRKVR